MAQHLMQEEKNLLIEEGFRKMNLCKNPHGNSGMLFLDEGDLKGMFGLTFRSV